METLVSGSPSRGVFLLGLPGDYTLVEFNEQCLRVQFCFLLRSVFLLVYFLIKPSSVPRHMRGNVRAGVHRCVSNQWESFFMK